MKIEKLLKWEPSQKIVARTIRGKLIIIPVEDGVANLNDVMFSFNITGASIWKCIEQKMSFAEICDSLQGEYDADQQTAAAGAERLITTLFEKGIIVECRS